MNDKNPKNVVHIIDTYDDHTRNTINNLYPKIINMKIETKLMAININYAGLVMSSFYLP